MWKTPDTRMNFDRENGIDQKISVRLLLGTTCSAFFLANEGMKNRSIILFLSHLVYF